METIENIIIDTVQLDKLYPLNMDTINSLFSSHHEDDCCESHYIDFDGAKSAVDTAYNLLPSFDKFTISGVPDMGILIRFINTKYADGIEKDTAVFFAGYASNNGYYSDNLTLIVTLSNGFKKEYDIREYQKNHYYSLIG